MTEILAAVQHTLVFFCQFRLLSAKTWTVGVALWAYVYEVHRGAGADVLAVVGGTVLLGVAAHIWGQRGDSR